MKCFKINMPINSFICCLFLKWKPFFIDKERNKQTIESSRKREMNYLSLLQNIWINKFETKFEQGNYLYALYLKILFTWLLAINPKNLAWASGGHSQWCPALVPSPWGTEREGDRRAIGGKNPQPQASLKSLNENANKASASSCQSNQWRWDNHSHEVRMTIAMIMTQGILIQNKCFP